MRTPALLLLALLAATAVPGTAHAKEVSAVQVCGASGCVPLPRDVARSDAFMQGGLAAEPPAAAAGWYTIRYTISPGEGEDIEPFTFRNAYVPSADRVRERAEGGGFAWFEPSRDMVRALAPYLDRVEPFPASRLRGLDATTAGASAPEPADPGVGSWGERQHGAAETGGGAPWGPLALAAAGAALLAALVGVARRRRAPRRPVVT